MKKIITLLCLVGWTSISLAQLPDGSIAPDFTLTDINGEEHNLYALLDEGKHVVLDILSTGCSPCWDYHEEGILKDVWNQHGPEGTDEMYVFMIETDLSSPVEYLFGNGPFPQTFGDWVTGTPYPIIDDSTPAVELAAESQVMYDYELLFWPTIYHICPDRTTTFIGQLPSVEEYTDLLDGCQTLSGNHNVRTRELLENYEIEGCGATLFAPTVRIQNMGNDMLTSMEITMSIDEDEAEMIVWNGSLAPYQYEDVSFSEIELGTYNLEMEVSNPNGNLDEFPGDNTVSSAISYTSTSIETPSITVDILTDIFGEDTYWAILNDAEEIMAEGGNRAVGLDNFGVGDGDAPSDPNSYGEFSQYEEEVLLPDGCYSLVVTDYWGDGMGGNGLEPGHYKIIDANGVEHISGSQFDGIIRHSFEMNSGAVSTNDLNNNVLAIDAYPNPAGDVLEIDIQFVDQAITEYQITLLNSLGQQMLTKTNHSTSRLKVDLDLSNYKSGMYYLTISASGGTRTILIVKE